MEDIKTLYSRMRDVVSVMNDKELAGYIDYIELIMIKAEIKLNAAKDERRERLIGRKR